MTEEEILRQVTDRYALNCPQIEVIRHNENMTYKVTSDNARYLLRIHRPVQGFSLSIFDLSDRIPFIKSELDIIVDLNHVAGLDSQFPVQGKNGSFIQTISDGTPVSLLEWVDGQTVEAVEQTREVLYNIGMMTAKMHLFFEKQSSGNKKYHRYSYDQSILSPIADRIHTANQRGIITDIQRQVVLNALDEMHRRFDELDKLHPKVLVHADLSKSNMVVTEGGTIAPIDFSLSGYSHFYMDIGGLFGHITKWEDRENIIRGYNAVRNSDISSHYIEPYFALQVILFIACQYERASTWDWFGEKMGMWCEDIFEPLAKGKTFLVLT